MSRFSLLLFVFLSPFLKVSAQRQNTYFIKNDGQYVTQRDSADYIRFVQEPEKGTHLYGLKEYYFDGTAKTLGRTSKIDPPLYEGMCRTFFPNGKKKMIANYSKGKITDTAYTYYPNGQLYKVVSYTNYPDPAPPAIFIKTVMDSTGKEMVVNGNGQDLIYDDHFKNIVERGPIKNGVPDGTWTGDQTETSDPYTEIYANGELVSGSSTDNQLVLYKYTKSFIQPQFKGGIDKFYKYLHSHVEYPPRCNREGIQGVAIVKFTVMKDGTLDDIRVINYVDPDMAKEAIRVIKACPPWEPGIVRGKIAKVSYNVPVSFTISN